MFRSRKRKVSPDKKTDKTKKLKVSNKIFRSPTNTKITTSALTSAKSKLNKLLPEGYEYIILTANTKPVESFPENEAVFGSVRLPIATKEDAMVWVKKFERKTFTSYRTQKTWKKDNNTGLLKRKYICNFRTREKSELSVPPSCKGNITLIIKDQDDIQANPEYYPKDYPSQAIIHFYHSHKIDPDSYMKNLRPSAELRIIFGTYFAKGHSPFSALICHKSDLHSSYGAEFYNVVSNGAICPSYNWCFNEYEKFFMRKFLEPSEERLKEKLLDNITQFNEKWRSECALISDDPVFVLSICTPLMKSVFRSGFAESFVSVRCFSTPKSVPKRQKLILFLCHTPIGSLPFGVVVTGAEDTDTVCKGIRVLVHMLGHMTYQPKTIITDENAVVSKALKRCFPESQLLFNEFQMLQSIWRIIRIVCPDDDEEFQALYNLFLVTLNSSSEEEFKKNFDGLLVYAEKYPRLTNFLKYFKLRADAYVFYARPKFEFDTDLLNYTDSGTTILQDVLIKYGNFFNIVQLFDFLSKNYSDHYERKLTRIVEGELKGFFKTNFYVPLSKIADFTCEKISDTEFVVSLNEMKFFVNAQLDTCTCQVGIYGGSCVHQYIVEKRLGLTPECYTPLCGEILNILKQILKEKNTKPPVLESENKAEFKSTLGSVRSDLESFDPEPDSLSDIVPSVGYSELSNFSGMPHDMDNLGPLEEVFSAPPDITDSYTDITEEAMSPLVLSEFEDAHEDNEDFLDDSELYNRESGELEPKEQSDDIPERDSFSDNFSTEIIPESLDQSVPSTSNVEICEYEKDNISCEDELDIEQGVPVKGQPLVNLPVDESMVLKTDIESSTVYTYPIQTQDEMRYFEATMTENERKTAEIAEFLTNLPDTNNLSSGTLPQVVDVVHLVDKNNSDDFNEVINTTDYIQDTVGPIVEQTQSISNGVVVLSNEEYFTNYNILENNVIAVVPDNENAMFSKNEKNTTDSVSYDVTTSDDAQNLITDSYEENNLVMMSPNDLFDDNQSPESIGKHEGKINVLSSVIIKPPTLNMFSLNLNSIKSKTLRNVKEDNLQRNKKSGIIQNTPDQIETRIIPLTVPEKESDVSMLQVSESNQMQENDVIKLYCNQSGDKISFEEEEQEEFLKQNQSNEIILENEFEPEKKADMCPVKMKTHSTNDLKTSVDTEIKNQELKIKQVFKVKAKSSDGKKIVKSVDTEIKKQESNIQQVLKVRGKNCDVKKIDQTLLFSNTGDKIVKDCKDFKFTDCDLEELAKHDFMEIEEIDSDDLEDLASQEYDPNVVSPIPHKTPIFDEQLPSEKALKLIPIKNVPSGMVSFSQKSSTTRSDFISLKDFLSKNKSSRDNKESSAKKQIIMPQTTGGLKNNAPLKKHILGRNTFKDLVGNSFGLSSDDTCSQVKDDTVEIMNKIQSLGNSITLKPIQTSTREKSPVKKAKTLNTSFNLQESQHTKQKSGEIRAETTPVNRKNVGNENTDIKINNKFTNVKQNQNNITEKKSLSAFKTFNQSDSKLLGSDSDEASNSNASYSILDELSEEELIALGIISKDYGSDDSTDRPDIYLPPPNSFLRTHLKSDTSIKSQNSRLRDSLQHQRTWLGNKNENNTVDSVVSHTDSLHPKENLVVKRKDLRRRTTTPKYADSNSTDDEFDDLIIRVSDLVDKTKKNVKSRIPVKKQDSQASIISKDQNVHPDKLQRLSDAQDFKRSAASPKTPKSPKSTKSISQKLLTPALKRTALPTETLQPFNPPSPSENKVAGPNTKTNVILTTSDLTPLSPNAKSNVKQAYLINFPNDVTIRKVCDTNQGSNQRSPNIIIDNRRFVSPKSNSRGKDIKDLEALLTSNVDTDCNEEVDAAFSNNKRIQVASLLRNKDLSFLFEDPRFETIVVEESAENAKEHIISSKSHVKNSRNKVSPKKVLTSANAFLFDDPQFKTIAEGKKGVGFTVQNISLKSHGKSIQNEVSPKKTKTSVDNRAKRSNDGNVTSTPSVQNNIITLMVFKDGTTKPSREILSRSNSDVSLNKKKNYNLVHTEIYKSTNRSEDNDNVNNRNRKSYEKHVPLETPKRRKEKNTTKEIFRNKAEDSQLSKNTRSKLNKSSFDKLEMEHISKEKSKVESLGDKDRSISSIKKKNNEVKSTQNAKVGFKNNTKEKIGVSKTQLATSSRRSLRNTQTNKEKESDISDKSNSNKDNIKTSFNKANTKITRTRSVDKQKNTDKTREHSKKALKSVASAAQNRHDSDEESQINTSMNRNYESKRWFTQNRSPSGKWISKSQERTRENKNVQVNNNKTESKKRNSKQRPTSSSKRRKPELDDEDSSLEPDTDDFEDSIVASVLERHPIKENKLAKQNKGIFASTPKKSIGYEDAFKMFLESSNKWSFTKELNRSVSDYEKDMDDSDWESSSKGSRRRTKSVSDPKKSPTISRNATPAKIKKSVSWADGLNRIDYIVESDSDSDDSEIVTKTSKSMPGKRINDVVQKSSRSSFRYKQHDRTDNSKSESSNTSFKGRFTSITSYKSYKTNDKKPPSSPAVKGHRSLTESPVSEKSRRSRSVTPKRNSVKPTRRSQSCSRAKQVEHKLVVLIERDRAIDKMCLLLNPTRDALRSRRGGRIGLKELLQRARSVKNI